MKAHSIKTDNANVAHKVQLRKEATQGLDGIRVLDLFAGNNVLWSNFDCEKYYGVEVVKGKGKNLNADNTRVIASLDLSRFNVIDCDSYGMPTKQLEQIFKNKTLQKETVIIYTCISGGMSGIDKVLIENARLEKMYKKVKTLLGRHTMDYFYNFLYQNGVREVREYQEKKSDTKQFLKKYGYFITKK